MKFNIKSKQMLVALIILVSLLIIGSLIAYNINRGNNPEKDITAMIMFYQLPNGLFVDTINRGTEIDTFSTCFIDKIWGLVNNDKAIKEFPSLSLTCDNMDEVYFLVDSSIEITQDMCYRYKEYIESLAQGDGLILYSDQNNEEIKLIFTLYAVKFAHQYNFELGFIRTLEENIQKRAEALSESHSLLYVSTILQFNDLLDIDYDKSFYYNYYYSKLDGFENSGFSGMEDVMDLYYLSIIKETIQIQSDISETLANIVAGQIYYSYTTLSIFYDSIFILKTYSLLDNYYDLIHECLTDLEIKYSLTDNYYTQISTETPSILATYYGVKLLKECLYDIEKEEAILAYLIRYYDTGYISLFTKEELYYYYKTVTLIDVSYIYDKDFVACIQNALLSALESGEKLSIRDLYCINLLNQCIFDSAVNIDMMRNYFNEIISVTNVDEISVANYCMLLIIANDFESDYSHFSERALNIESQLSTVMDAYYYAEYCERFKIKLNEAAVEKILNQLQNDNGYYISAIQKENTMFSLYLGFSLHKDVLNRS